MSNLVGALMISLGLDSANFKKGMSQAERQLVVSTKKFQAIGASLQDMGGRMTMALTAPFIAAGAAAVKGANDQAQAMAQVEASLKSMGNASGKTADELLKTSDALEMKSLFDGDVILKDLTANLLTFGNIAGKEFDRAQQAAVDFATKMDKDLGSSAIMVGKALNDPIKGMSALGKAGIQFSDSQKEAVKAMVATGDVAGAQNIILKELEKQYGGSAAAAANTSPWRQAQVAIGQMGDAIGTILIPYIRQAADFVAGMAQKFTALDPTLQKVIVGVGAFAAVAGPLAFAIGTIVSGAAPLIALFTSTGAAAGAAGAGMAGLGAALAPILPIVAAVAAAGVVLYTQWDKIQPVLAQVAKGMQEALGPKVTALVESFKGAMMKMQPLFDVIGTALSGFFKIMGPIWTATFASAIDIVSGFVGMVGDLIGGVIKLLTGDIDGAVDSFKSAFRAGFDTVIKIFGNFWTATKQIFGNFGVNLVQIGKDMIAGLVRGIKAAPGAVLDALMHIVTKGVIGVKDYLWIKSPSRLFMEMGGFMAEGMAIGVTNATPKVVTAIRGMGVAASDEMRKSLDKLAVIAREAQPLIDRLFPEDAKRRQFAADKAAIARTPSLSAAQKAEAQRRLSREYLGDFAGAVFDQWADRQDKQFAGLRAQFQKLGKAAQKDLQNPVERAVVAMARTVADAASAIGTALKGIGDAFKNGGFWDKLGAIADLVAAGAGVYGQVSGAMNGGQGGGGGQSSGLSSGIAAILGKVSGAGARSISTTPKTVSSSPSLMIPKGSSSSMAGGAAPVVKIMVQANDYFDAKVVSTSAGVTSQAIGQLESRRQFGTKRALA